VKTGIEVADPYVLALTPVLVIEIVPVDVMVPPDSPVPAVIDVTPLFVAIDPQVLFAYPSKVCVSVLYRSIPLVALGLAEVPPEGRVMEPVPGITGLLDNATTGAELPFVTVIWLVVPVTDVEDMVVPDTVSSPVPE